MLSIKFVLIIKNHFILEFYNKLVITKSLNKLTVPSCPNKGVTLISFLT
jgi:hypothetical protein